MGDGGARGPETSRNRGRPGRAGASGSGAGRSMPCRTRGALSNSMVATGGLIGRRGLAPDRCAARRNPGGGDASRPPEPAQVRRSAAGEAGGLPRRAGHPPPDRRSAPRRRRRRPAIGCLAPRLRSRRQPERCCSAVSNVTVTAATRRFGVMRIASCHAYGRENETRTSPGPSTRARPDGFSMRPMPV